MTTRAPVNLGRRGRAFWKWVQDRFEPSRVEVEILVETCRLLDRLDELDAVIRKAGLMVSGSTGQLRLNPAVAERRQTVIALARVLPTLGLEDAPESITTVRARRAAESRWAGHVKREAS